LDTVFFRHTCRFVQAGIALILIDFLYSTNKSASVFIETLVEGKILRVLLKKCSYHFSRA
jgi:hypothetical protein